MAILVPFEELDSSSALPIGAPPLVSWNFLGEFVNRCHRAPVWRLTKPEEPARLRNGRRRLRVHDSADGQRKAVGHR
jgi:hypothetical protein